ncbi:MAG: peptidase M23 [Bacteroidales bacterium]
MRYYKLVCFFLWLAIGTLSAQEKWRNPLDFPLLLSGNFGELRNNHFHTGIDLKTQGAEGKTVRAVQDGYVSRIFVSPWGYGRALYLNHPNGTTSVYGHLQRFVPPVSDYVAEQQYALESFSLDTMLPPDLFPVQKGAVIAFSGNSGSSAGPHLHFEIRQTETEACLNPLEFYKSQVKDNRPPRIDGFMIYPLEGRGAANGSGGKRKWNPAGQPVKAWGDIGVAVKAYDYMDGVANIYGVSEIEMTVDNELVFRSRIDRLSFDEARYINSFIDYEEWKERRSFYMKAFVEPGNRLSFIESAGRGIIHIDEERPYRISFLLSDIHGNKARAAFTLEGKRQPIPSPAPTGEYFHWKNENHFGAKGIRLVIPAGNLYDDIYFRYVADEVSFAPEIVHTLHNGAVPLHDRAQLSLRLQQAPLKDKRKYGIVRLQGARPVWIGGTYRNGWLDAAIRDFGAYTIMHDTTPPVITPVNPAAWVSASRITFRIHDNLSGIKSYRGEIDGQYALFEYDGKSHRVSYAFDKARLARGKRRLTFTVTDACGNVAVYERTFVW